MKKLFLVLIMLSITGLYAQGNNKNAKPLAGKKMVIVISSDQNEKAGMGITLGLSASKKGADVTIVLGAKALKFALKKGKQSIFLAKKLTHREILKRAIKNGAHLQVCYMCAKALGLTDKNFIKGSHVVKSLKIFNKIYESDAKVLSF